MTSAHTTLRELVAHLARAQRAFDAGHFEEAERAIGDALAIDPHNVQAADLRQRITRRHQTLAVNDAKARPKPAQRRVGPTAVRPAPAVPAGRVSAAAWSTFEQRVRGRRADRAVAEAQEALARGELDAAQAALTELDEVAPDDARRVWIASAIEASLTRPVGAAARLARPVPGPASELPDVDGRAVGAVGPRQSEAPRRPGASVAEPPNDLASREIAAVWPPPSEASSQPALEVAPPDHLASREIASAWPLRSEPASQSTLEPAAERPDDLGSRAAAGVAPRRLQRPSESSSQVERRKRSWAGAAVASGTLAASALLGFWLISSAPDDALRTAPPEDPQLPYAIAAPGAVLPPETNAPETLPAEPGAPVEAPRPTGDQPIDASLEPADVQPDDTAPSAAAAPNARAEVLPQTARVRPETTTTVTSPRPALDARVPEPFDASPQRPPDRPIEIARAEPTPPPLDAPMGSPINTPDTRRPADRPGGEVRPVTPVPAPPAAAATPAPAAAGAPASGAMETSAVRGVLDGYADAFSALDASATQRVWPGVDVQGLRRAFDQLNAQTVTFNRCDVNASGETAEAVCVGRATWVPKVGDRSPKSEPRTWRFALGRDGGEWVIDRVQVQR